MSDKGADWQSYSTLHASAVQTDLIESGICKQAAGKDAYDYVQAEYDSDHIRICYNFDQSKDDASAMDCGATFYISTGPAGTLDDPKRPLSYEDGMSAALYYGSNYQIEVNPANSGMEDGPVLVERCLTVLAGLKQVVGGQVTKYGQYDYPAENNSSGGSGTQQQTPQKEYLAVPNVTGATVAQVKSWLQSNGYKFSVSQKSTGFNAKTSCMMDPNSVVIDQSPKANATAVNEYSTSLTLIVDCEW